MQVAVGGQKPLAQLEAQFEAHHEAHLIAASRNLQADEARQLPGAPLVQLFQDRH